MESGEMDKILQRLDDISLRVETLHGLVEHRTDALQNTMNERCSGIEGALLKVCEKLLAREEVTEVRREFVG